jgi:hypothetical protein
MLFRNGFFKEDRNDKKETEMEQRKYFGAASSPPYADYSRDNCFYLFVFALCGLVNGISTVHSISGRFLGGAQNLKVCGAGCIQVYDKLPEHGVNFIQYRVYRSFQNNIDYRFPANLCIIIK